MSLLVKLENCKKDIYYDNDVSSKHFLKFLTYVKVYDFLDDLIIDIL